MYRWSNKVYYYWNIFACLFSFYKDHYYYASYNLFWNAKMHSSWKLPHFADDDVCVFLLWQGNIKYILVTGSYFCTCSFFLRHSLIKKENSYPVQRLIVRENIHSCVPNNLFFVRKRLTMTTNLLPSFVDLALFFFCFFWFLTSFSPASFSFMKITHTWATLWKQYQFQIVNFVQYIPFFSKNFKHEHDGKVCHIWQYCHIWQTFSTNYYLEILSYCLWILQVKVTLGDWPQSIIE